MSLRVKVGIQTIVFAFSSVLFHYLNGHYVCYSGRSSQSFQNKIPMGSSSGTVVGHLRAYPEIGGSNLATTWRREEMAGP